MTPDVLDQAVRWAVERNPRYAALVRTNAHFHQAVKQLPATALIVHRAARGTAQPDQVPRIVVAFICEALREAYDNAVKMDALARTVLYESTVRPGPNVVPLVVNTAILPACFT